MENIDSATTSAVVDLRERLKDMPKNMRDFSHSLRSLYVENALSSNEETVEKFRKLRDDTRNDAMVYLKGILPLTEKFIASISEYFACYDALEFDEWYEMLPNILESTIEQKQLSKTLEIIHNDILESLRKRHEEAMFLLTELKSLSEKFKKDAEEDKQIVNKKPTWTGLILCGIEYFIPVCYIKKDVSKVVSPRAEAENQEAARIAVRDACIPSFQSFIDGITKAAGFFAIMENKIRTLSTAAENAEKSALRVFYEVMKKEGEKIRPICQNCFAVLPDVRTDFEAIPTEGTDQNYVDSCQKKLKKTIKQKCHVQKLSRKVLEAIPSLKETTSTKGEFNSE